MNTTTQSSGAAIEPENLNELAQRWHENWMKHKNWREAEATANSRVAQSVARAALKNAADLGLSVKTFIRFDWEQNRPDTVERVVLRLLSDCFEETQEGRSRMHQCAKKLFEESGIRTKFSHELNDAGMQDILYVIREDKYYMKRKDGVWLAMNREHLRTMVCQRGMSTEGMPSECSNYLLWLALNRCVADISQVPMEADSDPEKCCTAYDLLTRPENPLAVLLGSRFLTRGNAVILSAPTGIGKSTLGAQIAVCACSGQPFFGIRSKAACGCSTSRRRTMTST